MYLVVGATGNIGRLIVPELLAAGKAVRAIGRSAERLQGLVDQGADARIGSLEDAAFVTEAVRGATAIFSMLPPSFTHPDFRAFQGQIGQLLAAAIKESGVSHVVNMSSIGAERSEGTGIVLGMHDHEERLNQLADTHIVHVRAASFMENWMSSIPIIKQMGFNGASARGDVAHPMIAVKDIAATVTRHLLKLDFSGHTVHDLWGPRDYSLNEITPILGAAIGKPDLPYVQFSYEDEERGLVGVGMSGSVAQGIVGFNKFINSGAISNLPRTAENTTPTTIEEFAQIFAYVYNQQ